MNGYGWVILFALLCDYSLNLAADGLTLRSLKPELPDELAGFYDPVTYETSQRYTRETLRFGIVTSTVHLVLILGFWAAGGFPALDDIVRGWHLGFVGTGLTYVGLLIFGWAGVNLPFRLYRTFVIEARFGFNKTTLRTFILDNLKILFLSIGLGAPLLAGILLFFRHAGPHAWLYCWGMSAIFILVIQCMVPTWIMPLFNRFQPLAEGELKDRIVAYAHAVRFPVREILVMDGSRRSSKANAFFTGLGRHKRIILFDTLVRRHTVEELLSILAHEVGHDKKGHLRMGLFIGIVHMALIFFLLSFFLTRQGLFDAFHMRHLSLYAGLVFFGMLYTPVEMAVSIGLNLLSRHQESEADRFAVETTGLVQAFITALKKLSAHNLSNLTPHPFDVFLRASHPPILDRIERIRRFAERPPNLTDG